MNSKDLAPFNSTPDLASAPEEHYRVCRFRREVIEAGCFPASFTETAFASAFGRQLWLVRGFDEVPLYRRFEIPILRDYFRKLYQQRQGWIALLCFEPRAPFPALARGNFSYLLCQLPTAPTVIGEMVVIDPIALEIVLTREREACEQLVRQKLVTREFVRRQFELVTRMLGEPIDPASN